MRVNSAFKGFFANQLVVRSGLAILILAIFSIASSFTDPSDRDLRAKQVNLMIRQIGHQLLLQAGDSSSRVLPVTETKEGTFLLRFEKKFDFSHDSLLFLSKRLLPKIQFPSGYTVTVHDCRKGDIVYGFQMNNTTPDILACSGRYQPSGCYTIEFTFPDFIENLKQENASLDPGAKDLNSVKADPQEVDSKSKALKAVTSDYGISRGTKELKSVKADPQEMNPGKSKTTIFDSPLMNMVYAGMLVLLIVTLLIWRFGKSIKTVAVEDQNHAVIKESVPELATLGKFLFNVKDQCLLLGNEMIGLTDKECKVLELLHKNFGELIPRETLMEEVWIKEGVITGRSLDMFVSKLRKKLSGDPELRITNVHGKGYKLEIPESQI